MVSGGGWFLGGLMARSSVSREKGAGNISHEGGYVAGPTAIIKSAVKKAEIFPGMPEGSFWIH